MQDSEKSDNLIKAPVQKLVRDLTEKYVRETVKEAARRALQKKDGDLSRELDSAWRAASEKDREQFSKELEEKISREILDGSTDAMDLQKRIDGIMEEQLDPVRLDSARANSSQKAKPGERPSSKKPLQGYLIKIFIAVLLISAGIYFALPVVFPAELSVSTTSLDFGVMEERSPSPLTFAISNPGRGTLSWRAYSDDPWIGLDPASGTNNGLVKVSIRGTPQPGTLKGFIYVQSDNHQRRRIQVNLRVLSPPEISIDPSILTFSKTFASRPKLSSQTLKIANSGEQTLEWNVAANRSWITLSNYEGTNDAEIKVGITGNQRPGTYYGKITITSNDKRIEVPVILQVIKPAKLAFSPNPLVFNFYAYSANPPQPQNFRIANDGEAELIWHISSEPWITATPASGTLEGGSSLEISVGIDTKDLEYEDRNEILAIDSNGGSAEGRVMLTRVIK